MPPLQDVVSRQAERGPAAGLMTRRGGGPGGGGADGGGGGLLSVGGLAKLGHIFRGTRAGYTWWKGGGGRFGQDGARERGAELKGGRDL